jgi:hypothetical protein
VRYRSEIDTEILVLGTPSQQRAYLR